MERLSQAKFFEMVESPSDDPAYCKSLEQAYEELSSRICGTTLAESDFPSRYNALSEVSVHLHALQGRLSLLGDDDALQFVEFYVEKMTNFVDSQMNLLLLSLEYPNTFKPTGKTQVVSPFQWSTNFTKNDLIEVIAALDAVGAVENKEGGKARIGRPEPWIF